MRRDDAAAASSTLSSCAPEGPRTLVRHTSASARTWGTSGPLAVSSSSSSGQTARSAAFRPTSHRLVSTKGKTYRVVTFGLAHGPLVAFGLLASLCFGCGGRFLGLGLCSRWTARSAAYRPALHRFVLAMGGLGYGLLLGALVISFCLWINSFSLLLLMGKLGALSSITAIAMGIIG